VSRERSAARNRLEYLLYRAVRAGAGALGPRALAALGSAAGGAFLAASARRREILRFNLALAFPEMADAERCRMAREVSRHFGRVSLDILRLQRLGREEFQRGVSVEGEQHIAEAAARGRGIIYLAAHMGLWEVAALTVGLIRPETFLIVNRPLDNPLLEAEVVAFRSRFGNEPLGKRKVLRTILEHLAARGAVGYLVDQRVNPDVGIEVPFFGQPTWTHPALARIVRKTRTPVVPLCALWEGPGRYQVAFFPPLLPDALGEDELEDLPMTRRFSEITEWMIRRRPEQWLWFHDRWRHLRLADKARATQVGSRGGDGVVG
jgi:KDO2-lipid IV(A) lauroyltransferase